MSAGGSVHALHTCPGHRKPMVAVPSAVAVANLGLRGDTHAIADSSRQVLLLESETLGELGLKPGEVKENITTSGIALMALARGQRIAVGAEVVLEVTKACSPCRRMDEIRPGLLREIAGRRGMLARVLEGGEIVPGSPITLLEK